MPPDSTEVRSMQNLKQSMYDDLQTALPLFFRLTMLLSGMEQSSYATRIQML